MKSLFQLFFLLNLFHVQKIGNLERLPQPWGLYAYAFCLTVVLVLDSPTCMIPSCLASTVSLAGEGVSTLQQLLAMARQKGGVDQGQHFIHTILQLEAEGAEEERRRGGQAAERTRPAVQTLQMKFKSAEQGMYSTYIPPSVYSPLLSTYSYMS